MKLADFTAPGLILSPLTGASAKSVLDELWLTLTRSAKLAGCVNVSEGLPSRILYGAVEMSGWALLHLRLPALKDPVFAYGHSLLPIAWPGCREAVCDFFLVTAPESDSGHYLAILSTIARLARDQTRFTVLCQAQTPAEIYQFLQKVVVGSVAAPVSGFVPPCSERLIS